MHAPLDGLVADQLLEEFFPGQEAHLGAPAAGGLGAWGQTGDPRHGQGQARAMVHGADDSDNE